MVYTKQDNRNNSIDKALKILLCFVPHNEELGTSEISEKLGFHKATVSRILFNLAKHGFLRRNPRTRKFALGPSVFQLAGAINRSLHNNLIVVAKPFIDDLRNKLKETVVLEILSGKNTVMAYIAEGPTAIRIAGTVGDILPLHVAAGAKAIVAFLPEERRRNLLKGKLKRFTPKTITDHATLNEQFEEIRRRGFAVDEEEHDIGITAVGVPILNHGEEPVAAVVVAGPSQRVLWEGDSSVVPLLKDVAAKISSQLFYKTRTNRS